MIILMVAAIVSVTRLNVVPVSYCQFDGQIWSELGDACHSDPKERKPVPKGTVEKGCSITTVNQTGGITTCNSIGVVNQ